MHAKLTLSKNLVWNNHERNQSNGSRNMKNVNFVPKDVQKIHSSHKISKKYIEQWGVLQKKLFLKIS